jgi:hypothetical protein
MARTHHVSPGLAQAVGDGDGAGQVAILRGQAGAVKGVPDGFEAGHLIGGLWRIEVPGGGEVGHQALEARGAAGEHRLSENGRLVSGAEAAHAGVEGEMVVERTAQGHSHAVVISQLRDGLNGGSKFVVDERRALERQKVAHDEDMGRDASLPENDALFDIADSEPACAFVSESPGHLNGAMTIGIGFHDWHHLDARADGCANGVVVGRKLVARNFHPAAACNLDHDSIVRQSAGREEFTAAARG